MKSGSKSAIAASGSIGIPQTRRRSVGARAQNLVSDGEFAKKGQTLGHSRLAGLALADMSRHGRYMADKPEVLNLLRARGDGWTSPAQIRAIIQVPDRSV